MYRIYIFITNENFNLTEILTNRPFTFMFNPITLPLSCMKQLPKSINSRVSTLACDSNEIKKDNPFITRLCKKVDRAKGLIRRSVETLRPMLANIFDSLLAP